MVLQRNCVKFLKFMGSVDFSTHKVKVSRFLDYVDKWLFIICISGISGSGGEEVVSVIFV